MKFSWTLKNLMLDKYGKCVYRNFEEYITRKVFSPTTPTYCFYSPEEKKSFLIGFKRPRDGHPSWQLSQVPPVLCPLYYLFDRFVILLSRKTLETKITVFPSAPKVYIITFQHEPLPEMQGILASYSTHSLLAHFPFLC